MIACSGNTEDGARVDIHARGFWNVSQDAFLDARVFHPNTSSNHLTNPSSSIYRSHEQAKNREYRQRIREVECGVFTLLSCLQLVARDGRQ